MICIMLNWKTLVFLVTVLLEDAPMICARYYGILRTFLSKICHSINTFIALEQYC